MSVLHSASPGKPVMRLKVMFVKQLLFFNGTFGNIFFIFNTYGFHELWCILKHWIYFIIKSKKRRNVNYSYAKQLLLCVLWWKPTTLLNYASVFICLSNPIFVASSVCVQHSFPLLHKHFPRGGITCINQYNMLLNTNKLQDGCVISYKWGNNTSTHTHTHKM